MTVKVDHLNFVELQQELERLHCSSFGWAMSCCGRNREQAEDVLQIAYLKVLEGKARFSGQSSFKTWLFSVIHKTAAAERRLNVLRRLRWPDERTPVRYIALPDQEDVIERSETLSRFQHALARLPARQQQTLHLVFYQDLSLQEAAIAMGISLGSVRQHYERGKRRLRESLSRSEISYGSKWRREETPGIIS